MWVGMGGKIAHAQKASGGGITSFLGFDLDLMSFVNTILSYIVNAALQMLGWLLSLVGILLNVSMNLTTHLKSFIGATPVIYTVWGTIRDLSSMLLIFFILWAAIQMILSLKPPSYGTMIRNMVIMGILINFSFFMTSVLIDASNIVSLQFYNAIAPNQTVDMGPMNSVNEMVAASLENGDGGISGIFMGALKINQWWNNRGLNSTVSNTGGSSTGLSTTAQIILTGFAGIIVLIITILSFLAVVIACIWRIAVLIFLLGFSPVWIASWVIPNLKDFAKQWTDQLKANLIFLPVYLLFMYVAIKIIADSKLNTLTGNVVNGGVVSGGLGDFINLFVGFAIIIVMLNIPIFVAIKVSGLSIKAIDSLQGSIEKFSRWATVGRLQAGAGWAGRNTAGRFGSSVEKWAGNQKFDSRVGKIAGALVGVGNSEIARGIRAATVGKAAQAKYGGSRSWKDQVTINKDIASKDKEIERRKEFGTLLTNLKAGQPPVVGGSTMKDVIGKMSEKEKLSIKPNDLKDPNVIRYLKKGDFEAIKKSDDFSKEDKDAIEAKRKEIFETAIRNDDEGMVKDMLKNYDGKELLGIDQALLTGEAVIKNYTNSQLKEIGDHSNSEQLKTNIADAVIRLHGLSVNGAQVRVPTFGWISDQRSRGIW